MDTQYVLEEIEEWEKSFDHKHSDVETKIDEWIGKIVALAGRSEKESVIEKIDELLFFIHANLQGTRLQKEARDSIIDTARIFNSDIRSIQDLRHLSIHQLTYLAKQEIARGKLSSFVQGGLSGTGGLFLLSVDFPLMLIMNLRLVQLIGLCFGRDVNHPSEMMFSLKLFHAATLPKRSRKSAWLQLIDEAKKETAYLYEGEDKVFDASWLDQPIKQLTKSLILYTARKKTTQGFPITGMAIGAVTNYKLTSSISDHALRFYQKRYFIDQRM
ncbi:EcsC family protein [Sediminibacillus massiliensis]|uniref:EcsC family protein n=1 Tax=Sediminibacillus massiliensis TaxID=1926277 RepID=UPI0009888014|nr:EcsC family protein [Sediminibacillus massiliensis]